ncbi:hypothetical protein TNCV_303681 [Trichonephila clavipes]|nr:hypothetical protein TNCV_303681 [Trichonephila clavipes]
MVTSDSKVVSWLWNKLTTSGTVTRKLARDLAAVSRRTSRPPLYSRFEETVLYARRPILCGILTASGRKYEMLRS